jgi:hypothetical protein
LVKKKGKEKGLDKELKCKYNGAYNSDEGGLKHAKEIFLGVGIGGYFLCSLFEPRSSPGKISESTGGNGRPL